MKVFDKKRPLFLMRSFNDVDHIAPIVWKFIENNEKPVILFTSNYPYENDYRILFLQSQGDIEIKRHPPDKASLFLSKIRGRIRHTLIDMDHYFYTLLLGYKNEKEFIKDNGIYTTIFEWGEPWSRGPVVEKYFMAAKKLKVPTFSVPHGCKIYTNVVVNRKLKELEKKGIKINQSHRSKFDSYVVQSQYHRKQFIEMGMRPDNFYAWGSTRFYPEWQNINLSICPPFSPKKNDSGKAKVIFMLPHWDYNVKKQECLNLINMLVQNDYIYLIIKDHTRDKVGGLSDEERMQFSALPNVETDVDAHSPSLIKWSDAVINFGSSIGIEALLQNKLLINPTYLHTNTTIYEETEAAFTSKNAEEVLNVIKRVANGETVLISEKDKKILYKEVIYGGRDDFNVLDYYYNRISLKK